MFVISGEYPPESGGVSDHSLILAQALLERNLTPMVVCGGDSGMVLDNGFLVHRVGRRFLPADMRHLAGALQAKPGRRFLWVQYAPHALGLRGMNLPLALWLAWRAWFHRDMVMVYFHEVAFPFRGPWKHKVLSMVQNAMAAIVAASASAVLVTTEAWLPRLRLLGMRRGAVRVLPVFSNLSEEVAHDAVSLRRREWLAATGATHLIGHFGTYGGGVAALLAESFATLINKSDVNFLLMGRNASTWLAQHADQPWATRCRVVPENDPVVIAETLAACDAALQPYPDGITTRRTTAMSALSLGVPLVSNDGPLTDLCWRTDLPCARLAAKPHGAALATSLSEVLQLPLAERLAAGAHGRAWYTVHASRAHAAKVVKQIVEECQHT